MTIILVTGCAGFIGYHLTHKLLTSPPDEYKNATIYGIDTLNNYYSKKYQEQKKQNVLELQKLGLIFSEEDIITTQIIERIKPSIVVHLAAYAGVRYSLEKPELYIRTNIEGTTNLLKQAVETKNVQNFVYASSSSVYGRNTKIPFKETDILDNINSPYAVSKRSKELICKLYSDLYGLTTIGLRFFTVYGPRGRHDMAPYKFLTSIMEGKPITKYGDGTTYRDYTYIDDIVSGVIESMRNKKGRKCEVYNLGNNKPVNLNTFIETCEKVTKQKAVIQQCPKVLGDVDRTYADIGKAQTDLGYNPKVVLEQGLLNFYDYLCKNDE